MDKKLIILDIDETLIHATESPLQFEADFETDYYFVYKRPHVDKFIQFCLSHFKVAVWTSAGSEFADIVVSHLFGEHKEKLEFLWSRDRCTPMFDAAYYNHEYLKNLSKVKRRGFKLEEVIMIDDTPAKLKKNYGNLVRVREFTGNQNDRELLILMKYLVDLKLHENMRSVEKRGWQAKYES